jgi:hypothetical protein
MSRSLQVAKVLIDIVVTLSLTLRKGDKIARVLLSVVPVVFTCERKRVDAGFVFSQQRKVREIVLCVRLELRLHIIRSFFSPCDECINILVGVCPTLAIQNLVGTEANHFHEFIFLQRPVLFRQTTLLNDRSVQKELTVCTLDDFLLDGTFRDEAKDLDRLFLSNTVGAILSLQINLVW